MNRAAVAVARGLSPFNVDYFWLSSAEVAKERVATGVSKGGHTIPVDVIERRYGRSIVNLTKLYVPICDYFTVFNNAGLVPQWWLRVGLIVD